MVKQNINQTAVICYIYADSHLISASRIKLGKKLGEGGFGTVYLSDLDGTLVAIKQLKLDRVADVDHMNKIKALRFVCYDYFLVLLSIRILQCPSPSQHCTVYGLHMSEGCNPNHHKLRTWE